MNLIPGIANQKSRNIYSQVNEKGIACLVEEKPKKEKFDSYLHSLHKLLISIKGREPSKQIEEVYKYYAKLKRITISEKRISENKKEEETKALERSLSNIDILLSLAEDYKSVRDMLDDFALNVPAKDNDKPSVNVTTVHSAKGLEYDVVYLINPAQRVFPKTMEDNKEEREDLRCMYVAITRPRKELYICFAQEMQLYNSYIETKISYFFNYPDVLNKAECPRDIYDMLPDKEDGGQYGSW